MTNEQFLATIEPHVGTRSYAHAEKLVAAAEATKKYFKKEHCTCLDGDECPDCRENREMCQKLLKEMEKIDDK